LLELSLELGRESNFDEMFMPAYGCEHSLRVGCGFNGGDIVVRL
jgi:hypothetical protein